MDALEILSALLNFETFFRKMIQPSCPEVFSKSKVILNKHSGLLQVRVFFVSCVMMQVYERVER